MNAMLDFATPASSATRRRTTTPVSSPALLPLTGPRFSVVVPLYNKAPVVAQTLATALADRQRVLEVIVVDDGSTDGGAAVVAAIQDPLIRLIRQPNAGVSCARNRGIEAARGEWIAFLDADDVWLPGYLGRLEELIGFNPDCAMVATRYLCEDSNGHRHGPEPMDDAHQRFVRIDDFYAFMVHGQVCCTITTAVRRSLLMAHKLRFREGENLGEDLDFFLRVSEHTPLALAPEPLAVYVFSDQVGHLSLSWDPRFIPPFLKRLDARCRAQDMPVRLLDSAREYVRSKFEYAALTAIQRGQRTAALRVLTLWPPLRRPGRWLALFCLSILPSAWSARLYQSRQRWRESLQLVLLMAVGW